MRRHALTLLLAAATVFALLGIDPETHLLTPDQQPIRIVDQGTVIAELLGRDART